MYLSNSFRPRFIPGFLSSITKSNPKSNFPQLVFSLCLFCFSTARIDYQRRNAQWFLFVNFWWMDVVVEPGRWRGHDTVKLRRICDGREREMGGELQQRVVSSKEEQTDVLIIDEWKRKRKKRMRGQPSNLSDLVPFFFLFSLWFLNVFFFRGEGVVVGLEIWDCIKAAMQFSTLICCLPPPPFVFNRMHK